MLSDKLGFTEPEDNTAIYNNSTHGWHHHPDKFDVPINHTTFVLVSNENCIRYLAAFKR